MPGRVSASSYFAAARLSMFTCHGIAALLALTLVLPALAARHDLRNTADISYPTRPIRLVVGLPAGGTADVLARVITSRLSDALGQQIVVDNRPGASGLIAPQLVVSATPDGYTLLLRASFFAELVASTAGKLPYDMLRDFAPISLMWRLPNVLVVSQALPVSSVKEFVAYAKAHPGKLQYASSGVGTSTHLAMELLKKQAGISVLHVPYKGAPQSIADLLGGQIHAMFGNVTAQLPHVRGGKLRALAVTSAERIPQLPDVPTMRQAGFGGVEFTVWGGVVAPAGVPGAILTKLNAAWVKTLRLPEVIKSLAAQGAEAAPSTPAEFAAFQQTEVAKWTPIVKESGAALE